MRASSCDKERYVVSLGVTLPEAKGVDDTVTISDKQKLHFSRKGDVYKTYECRDIWRVVQNRYDPTHLTFYFKNGLAPFFCVCSNETSAFLTCSMINDGLYGHFTLLNDVELTIFKQSPCEKEGRHHWAKRYGVIQGYKLLVYRHEPTKVPLNEQIPLNVIDLIDAKLEKTQSLIITVTTHRKYQLRFPDEGQCTEWLGQLDLCHMRGMRESDRIRASLQSFSAITPSKPTISTSEISMFKDRSIYIWGRNITEDQETSTLLPQRIDVVSTPKFKPMRISSGENHMAIVDDQYQLFMMGSNDSYQCGLETNHCSVCRPQQIPTLMNTSIRFVECGSCCTFAITESGSVLVWGKGEQGQLGLGPDTTLCSVPTEISSLKDMHIVCISAGVYHTLFLDESGTCYATGNGYYGQLGLGKNEDSFVPKKIHLPFPVEKMSCGGTFSLFQTRNGLLYVSGYIGMTEEEFNSSKDLYNTPFLYPFPSEQVTDISAGYDYALALTVSCGQGEGSESKVYSWGCGIGQGRGEVIGFTKKPTEIQSLCVKSITSLYASLHHCFAYSSITNSLFAWGECPHGELGVGAIVNYATPQPIRINSSDQVYHIACGLNHTVALTYRPKDVDSLTKDSPAVHDPPPMDLSPKKTRPSSMFRPPALSSKLSSSTLSSDSTSEESVHHTVTINPITAPRQSGSSPQEETPDGSTTNSMMKSITEASMILFKDLHGVEMNPQTMEEENEFEASSDTTPSDHPLLVEPETNGESLNLCSPIEKEIEQEQFSLSSQRLSKSTTRSSLQEELNKTMKNRTLAFSMSSNSNAGNESTRQSILDSINSTRSSLASSGRVLTHQSINTLRQSMRNDDEVYVDQYKDDRAKILEEFFNRKNQ